MYYYKLFTSIIAVFYDLNNNWVFIGFQTEKKKI